MKKILVILSCLIILTGCGTKEMNTDDAVVTRDVANGILYRKDDTKEVFNVHVTSAMKVFSRLMIDARSDAALAEEATLETTTKSTTTTATTTTTTKNVSTTTKKTTTNTKKVVAPTDLTEEKAYEILMSIENEYPEGTPWNDNSYSTFHGGNFSGGWGCVGFTYLASDRVFGNLPMKRITDFSKIRVGDIFRYQTGSYGHSVIVLEVKEDRIVVLEGNWQKKVHWGREITFDFMNKNGVYIYTRWPE